MESSLWRGIARDPGLFPVAPHPLAGCGACGNRSYLGVEEPIAAVVSRYDLRGMPDAAVHSALAVPDRVAVVDVLPPAT